MDSHIRWLLLVASAFVVLNSAAEAGSIFDDNWVPPKAVQQTPPPAATAAPPPAVAPATQPSKGPAAVSSLPRMVPPPQRSRLAVPPASQLAVSRGLLKDVFAAQLKDPSVPARRKLSQMLIEEANKADVGASDQFTLFDGALHAAMEGGDLRGGVNVADLMAAAFDVDPLSLKTSCALNANLRADSPARALENVEPGMSLVEALIAAEDFADASRLAALLRPIVAADAAKLSLQQQTQRIEKYEAARNRIIPSLDRMKGAPTDSTANAEVGKYYLVLERFDRALPMLARGSDPGFKAAAAADISMPRDSAAQKAVGDLWWDLSVAHPDCADPCKARVVYWYSLAAPQLSGLTKMVVDKRLTSLPSAASTERATPIAPSSAGMTGSAANAGVGVVVHLLPLVDDRDITHANWSRNGAAFVSNTDEDSGLSLPYYAPREFDFAAEFTRTSGNGDIILTFPVGESACNFVVGANGNKFALFGKIDDKSVDGNPTLIRQSIDNNTRHRIEVRVRREEIAGSLDGKELCRWRTTGEDLAAFPKHRPSMYHFLELGSYKSTVEFHLADVTDRSGGGMVIRDRDANGWHYNPTTVHPAANGTMVLIADDATTHGSKLRFECEKKGRCIGSWHSSDEHLSWFVDVLKPGDYAVALEYSCDNGSAGSNGALDVVALAEGALASSSILIKIDKTGGWYRFANELFPGKLRLPGGKQMIEMKMDSIPRSAACNVRQIVLSPAR